MTSRPWARRMAALPKPAPRGDVMDGASPPAAALASRPDFHHEGAPRFPLTTSRRSGVADRRSEKGDRARRGRRGSDVWCDRQRRRRRRQRVSRASPPAAAQGGRPGVGAAVPASQVRRVLRDLEGLAAPGCRGSMPWRPGLAPSAATAAARFGSLVNREAIDVERTGGTIAQSGNVRWLKVTIGSIPWSTSCRGTRSGQAASAA